MEIGEFESLARKVEQAVSLIGELKRERDGLKTELHGALEKAGHLERELTERNEETQGLRRELGQKSENMSVAGERIRDLVSRLETALA